MVEFSHYGGARILSIIAFIEAVFVAVSPSVRPGLGMLFLLPFVFGIMTFLCAEIFQYASGGVGLKIFYGVEIIRFLVLPLLMIASDGAVSSIRMSSVSAGSYSAAVFIQCIEIVVSFLTIKYYYTRTYEKAASLDEETIAWKYPETLSSVGWIILAMFAAILVLRISVWLPALNIYGIKETTSDLKIVLENTFLTCIKIAILAALATKCSKCEWGTSESTMYFAFTMVWLVFNSLSYFGTNRIYVLENIIASIFIVSCALPRARKWIVVVVVPMAISLVVVMFVTKQFDLTSSNDFSVSLLSIQGFSNFVEEYCNGLWCVAQTFDASKGLSFDDRFMAFAADWLSGLGGLGDLPIIKSLINAISDWPSSSDIMKAAFEVNDRGQMVSFSGCAFMWGGQLAGWFIVLIINYIAVRILIYVEVKSKLVQSLYYKYMYVWLSIPFGITHCYCIQTLIYCWAKFILIYWCVLKIAQKFRISGLDTR